MFLFLMSSNERNGTHSLMIVKGKGGWVKKIKIKYSKGTNEMTLKI